jgi:hypothetical protein
LFLLGAALSSSGAFNSAELGFADAGPLAFRSGTGRCPSMFGGDAAFDDAGAFGFEKATLEAGEGLSDDDPSSGGNHAVPGDTLTARASSHGSAGGTSAAGEPHGARQLAVGGDASFGDALDEGVESLPGGVHGGKDSRNVRELPDTKASGFAGKNFRG